MYTDDIKIVSMNEKELETVKLDIQEIGTGFNIDKCSIVITKRGEEKQWKEQNCKKRKHKITKRKRYPTKS